MPTETTRESGAARAARRASCARRVRTVSIRGDHLGCRGRRPAESNAGAARDVLRVGERALSEPERDLPRADAHGDGDDFDAPERTKPCPGEEIDVDER